MTTKRTIRLNSLLKQVISEAIHRDLHHVPFINEFVTITRVEVTSDLNYAKVFITVIGDEHFKKSALGALQDRTHDIWALAARKVNLRHFPQLSFDFDHDLDKRLHMEELLHKISKEREDRLSKQDPNS